jgi:hypothetical protein
VKGFLSVGSATKSNHWVTCQVGMSLAEQKLCRPMAA